MNRTLITLPDHCDAIALCGGPYSNFAAVEAFLATTGGLPRFCLGDLGGPGPYPDRTIARIRESYVVCMQGNYDYAVGHERTRLRLRLRRPARSRVRAGLVRLHGGEHQRGEQGLVAIAARADPDRVAPQAHPARPREPGQRQRVRVGTARPTTQGSTRGSTPRTCTRSARRIPACRGSVRRGADSGATSACSAGRRTMQRRAWATHCCISAATARR